MRHTLLKKYRIPATLFLLAFSISTFGQVNRPQARNSASQPLPANPPGQKSDSVVEERLVQLALGGPAYDVSFHQIRLSEFKVKAVKKTWFDLLTLSLNYNETTFEKIPAGYGYPVYPKYFFGLVLPIGTLVSKGAQIKAAREDVKINEDNQIILARQIRADVLSKYKQYKTLGIQVVMQNQVVDDIHAAFLQIEKRFNDGTVTIEAYSEASRTYNGELTKQLNLQLQQDMTKLEIEKIIGVKLETVINY